MRFPRNVKIFRGQIDVAAIASVFFLLILFLLVSSLLYIPGIPLKPGLAQGVNDPSRRSVVINKQGEITFEGRNFGLGSTEELKARIKATPGISRLVVQADTGAPRELVLLLRDIARELRLGFETQNVPLQLPTAEGPLASGSASLVVAINLGGQFFFENQLVTPEQLGTKLRQAVSSYKVTPSLVVMADEATEHRILVKLSEIAARAGIRDILMATRVRPYEKPKESM